MNVIKGKRVAIVGGGPGGLTLARLLQMRGADVQVYERDKNKDARQQGATLDLHEESGLAALAAAGLMDAFWMNYRPGADMMRIVDKNATLLFDDHVSNKDETERRRPEIDRGPLQQILLDSLKTGTVVWDCHFVALVPQGDGWKLEFKNGTFAVADIVIGADGGNSKVRQYITPARPFYSGITIVEGAVYNSATTSPRVHELLKGGKIFAMDDEKSFVVSSKGDGSLVFYTGCKTQEDWGRKCGIDFADKAQMLAWFREEFAGWSSIWDELYENAVSDFVVRPQYCMPLDQAWETLPNLTMLGDAAHLMPPFAGEGVNMAMLDALELANCLASADLADTSAAIAAYEKQMLARFAIVGKDTLEQTELLHSENAITYLLAIFSGHPHG